MKIALIGYGKMGQTIERLALEKGHSVVFKSTRDSETGQLEKANVAIEFSTPEAATTNILRCFSLGIPVVCGTTGWLDAYEEIVKECEKCNGSFLYASNFSIGVNLFFNMNAYLAKLMAPWKQYQVSMEEIHHTQKKDAPSGTAITLAEAVLQHRDLSGWSLQEEEGKLHIDAVREGDVKGTHIIRYDSPIDTISIAHEAHTRDGFALGAILAAEWLVNRKGIYTMKDVLQLF